MLSNLNYTDIQFDLKEFKKQLKYFRAYYGDNFRKNQGSEELLEIINDFSVKGNWIDFGSGSNIYFWASALKEIDDISCVDISYEAFLINEMIRKGKLKPLSYTYVYKKYNLKFHEITKIPLNYIIEDIFNNRI